MFWVRVFSLLRVRGCLDDWTSNVFSGVIFGGLRGGPRYPHMWVRETEKKQEGVSEWLYTTVCICVGKKVWEDKNTTCVCTHKCVRKRSQQQCVCVCMWSVSGLLWMGVSECEWVRVRDFIHVCKNFLWMCVCMCEGNSGVYVFVCKFVVHVCLNVSVDNKKRKRKKFNQNVCLLWRWKKTRTKMENQFEEGQKQTSIYFEIEFGFPKIVASFC